MVITDQRFYVETWKNIENLDICPDISTKEEAS